jgi:hypothetical protein
MTLVCNLVFTVQPCGGYHNVSGPLAQLRIGQDPVGQNIPLLEKNVISGSQQDMTASYQHQVLLTEYGEELESVYSRRQSAIHLMLPVSNQEEDIQVWS